MTARHPGICPVDKSRSNWGLLKCEYDGISIKRYREHDGLGFSQSRVLPTVTDIHADVRLEPVTVRTSRLGVTYATELPIFAREDHPEVSDLE